MNPADRAHRRCGNAYLVYGVIYGIHILLSVTLIGVHELNQVIGCALMSSVCALCLYTGIKVRQRRWKSVAWILNVLFGAGWIVFVSLLAAGRVVSHAPHVVPLSLLLALLWVYMLVALILATRARHAPA
ncbi:MAG: hypothetical protein IPM64_01290 [Phycisphaerales bacterium]|nr:hypothetical protein [Phycisphaerales bacterium]